VFLSGGDEGERRGRVSESKHTPGPYLFVPAIKGFPGLDRHLVVAVAAQDTPLARLDADNETAEANGRLFSTSPDLLAALLAYVEWHGPTCEHATRDDCEDGCPGRPIDDAVNAAISKATGGAE
jgi:hypothetical protein